MLVQTYAASTRVRKRRWPIKTGSLAARLRPQPAARASPVCLRFINPVLPYHQATYRLGITKQCPRARALPAFSPYTRRSAAPRISMRTRPGAPALPPRAEIIEALLGLALVIYVGPARLPPRNLYPAGRPAVRRRGQKLERTPRARRKEAGKSRALAFRDAAQSIRQARNFPGFPEPVPAANWFPGPARGPRRNHCLASDGRRQPRGPAAVINRAADRTRA